MLPTSVIRSHFLVISMSTPLSFACTNPFSAPSDVVGWDLSTTPPRRRSNVPAVRCRTSHLFAIFAYFRFAIYKSWSRAVGNLYLHCV